MTKSSHAAVPASEFPTPAQLKELFGQIQSGRVTKDSLQEFLRPTDRPGLRLRGKSLGSWRELERIVDVCARLCPGGELKLVAKLLPFLVSDEALSLKEPQPNLEILKDAIFWGSCRAVRCVPLDELLCDFPSTVVLQSLQSAMKEWVDEHLADKLEQQDVLFGTIIYELFPGGMMETSGPPWTGLMVNWKLRSIAAEVRFQWLKDLEGEHYCSISNLLDQNLSASISFATALLACKCNKYIRHVLTMLDVWHTGNFPVGFDRDGQLIVLCA